MPRGIYQRTKKHGKNISKSKTGKRTSISTEFKKNHSSEFYGKIKCLQCKEEIIKRSPFQKWCKKCVPDKKTRDMLRKYGLSRKEYLKMIEDVSGICPVCNKRKAIFIDHDHKTNKVRGILCGYCNLILPLVEDKKTLKRAIKYLNFGALWD